MQPSPGSLAALLGALREVDARFADAIEAALLDAKAQQLTALRENLRAPLSAVDEALLRAWEQLWEMALSTGQQRATLQEQMRQDAEERRHDEQAAAAATAAATAAAVAAAAAAAREEAVAAAAAAAREAAAAAAQRVADAKQSDAEGGSRRAQAVMEQLEAQLLCEKQAAAELRSQLRGVTASAVAEAEELRAQLQAMQEDLAAAQGSDELQAHRALVESLREEVARQRSMRLGGLDGDARQVDALQMEVDALAAQLARQDLAAVEARQALLTSWQEERDALLSQLETETALLRAEAEALTSRLSTQHKQVETSFASRLAQLKQVLREASGDGAAFGALEREHAAHAAAAAQRHDFELGELRASAEAEQGRAEAAGARLDRSVAHASHAVLACAHKTLAEAPAEATEGAAAATGRGEVAAVTGGAVAAMQASCIDCVSAVVRIAQEMARRAQLARGVAAELYGLSGTSPASEIDALPLPQLAKVHAAQLDELVNMLRLAPRPRDTRPVGMDTTDPDSVAFKEMAVEIVRQGQRLSTAAAAATHAQRREASSLQSVRRQLCAHALPDRAVEALHGMAARHQDALERAEARREQLRAARAATLERGMQAFTTIIYHGSMFGGAISLSPRLAPRVTLPALSCSALCRTQLLLPNCDPTYTAHTAHTAHTVHPAHLTHPTHPTRPTLTARTVHTAPQSSARSSTPRLWDLLRSPREQRARQRSASALCRHNPFRL